ncbi:MAG: Na+/H+ antiporter subunit D [Polyangiaceae bacterium]|nr:Na+/H+ antiporter subunit D [Polyangiaceae bacterium]
MSAGALLALPILIPLATAITALLAAPRRAVQRAIGLAGSAALLAAALLLFGDVWRRGALATQAGGWPAPFGVTLVADTLSAVMVALSALIGLAVTVYARGSPEIDAEAAGYDPPFQILMMGCSGAFLTGDVFNLYVWFEVMLIASFVLISLGPGRARVEGSLKYVALSLLASTLLLLSVGILYGLVGTLNMADAARKLARVDPPGRATACATLFLVALGIKAAFFPLFAWLPASYHTPPAATSALLGGLLTKVAVYALIRVFTLLFTHDTAFTHGLILAISALTMITGVLGAAAQHEVRRILSFHVVSQIGYMGVGLGLLSRLGLAGAVFFLVHIVIVKTALFLVGGVASRLGGDERLERLGGLYRARPGLTALFLISALSLAGVPPLSGFFAKLALVRAGLEAGRWIVASTALLVSLLTLYSMLKIWNEAFWKPAPGAPRSPGGRTELAAIAPAAALTALAVAAGLGAGPLLAVSLRAADELLDPAGYIAAVLGPAAEARR